jgi:hypothetical protein
MTSALLALDYLMYDKIEIVLVGSGTLRDKVEHSVLVDMFSTQSFCPVRTDKGDHHCLREGLRLTAEFAHMCV